MPIPLTAPSPTVLLPSADVAVQPAPKADSFVSVMLSSAVKAAADVAQERSDARKFKDQALGFADYFEKSGQPQLAELVRGQAATAGPDYSGRISGLDTNKQRASLLDGVLAFSQKQQDLHNDELRAANSAAANRGLSVAASTYNNLLRAQSNHKSTEASKKNAYERSRQAAALKGLPPGEPYVEQPFPLEGELQAAKELLDTYQDGASSGAIAPNVSQNGNSGSININRSPSVSPKGSSNYNVGIPFEDPDLPQNPGPSTGPSLLPEFAPDGSQAEDNIPISPEPPQLSGVSEDPVQATYTAVLQQKDQQKQSAINQGKDLITAVEEQAVQNRTLSEDEIMKIKRDSLLAKSQIESVQDPSSQQGQREIKAIVARVTGSLAGAKSTPNSDQGMINRSAMIQLDGLVTAAETSPKTSDEEKTQIKKAADAARIRIGQIEDKSTPEAAALIRSEIGSVEEIMRAARETDPTTSKSGYSDNAKDYIYLKSYDQNGVQVDYFSKDGIVYIRERGSNIFSKKSNITPVGLGQAMTNLGYRELPPPDDINTGKREYIPRYKPLKSLLPPKSQ